MAGATLLLRLMHACQVLLCSYGGYQSYLAVTRLQTYESAVKKMAKWSKEVDSQLQRTRTTQASGAVAVRQRVLQDCMLQYTYTHRQCRFWHPLSLHLSSQLQAEAYLLGSASLPRQHF